MEEKVKFLELPDGRQISYREQGVPKHKARRSLLVLHGLGSSRLASMPGVSEDLLEEMGLRLVSIDRPGYGLSSSHPQQTFETAAKDVANIADILELGEKIWLLGYSCGGAFCWGTAHHIPERIAGIAMWAPAGNYWWKVGPHAKMLIDRFQGMVTVEEIKAFAIREWCQQIPLTNLVLNLRNHLRRFFELVSPGLVKFHQNCKITFHCSCGAFLAVAPLNMARDFWALKDFTDAERNAMMDKITLKSWMMLNLSKLVPSWLIQAYVRYVMVNHLVGKKWMDNARAQLSPADQRNLDLAASSDLMIRDSTESAKQNGFGLAHDLHLLTSNWGFELSDVVRVYRGPLHIWQGDEDRLVPLCLQQLIKEKIPDLVTLHELPGEGHLSPFCFNDKGHRDTLTTLFGETRDEKER